MPFDGHHHPGRKLVRRLVASPAIRVKSLIALIQQSLLCRLLRAHVTARLLRYRRPGQKEREAGTRENSDRHCPPHAHRGSPCPPGTASRYVTPTVQTLALPPSAAN